MVPTVADTAATANGVAVPMEATTATVAAAKGVTETVDGAPAITAVAATAAMSTTK